MIRDVWEFMSKESRARVIFGVAIVVVIAAIAIPYFANVLGSNNAKSNVDTAVKAEESAEPEEEIKKDAASEVAENMESTTEASSNTAVAEEAEAYPDTSTGVVASTSKRTTASKKTTADQPAAGQTTSAAAPTETVNRGTTVDDNSGNDNGYTGSNIDNPGAEDSVPTNPDESEGGEV